MTSGKWWQVPNNLRIAPRLNLSNPKLVT